MAKTMKATIELGGKVDKSLLNSMSKAERQMALLKKSAGTIGRVGAAVAKATTLAATAAGAAVAKVVKDSIEVGKEFDAAMSQVSATLGMTSEDIANNVGGAADTFDALRAKAQEMGRSTIYTATQASEGLNILAMSGYDATDSMAMIEDVLHLAAAGSMDMAAAAGYLSGSIKGFSGRADDARRYADLMAKGATLANTSVQELGEAMSDGAAGAAAYGQSADGMTVSLLRLAEQGEVGAAAGTALAAAYKNLYSPTDQAKKVLDSLGVAAYDAEGRSRDFNAVTNELAQSLAGYTEEEQAAYKQTIFGIQGLDAYNKMTVTGIEKQEAWTEALAGASEGMGEAARQYGTMTDNLEGDLAGLGSAYEGVQIAISDALTPAMREFVQFGTRELGNMTDVLTSAGFTEWAEDVAKDVTGALEAGVAALGDFKDGFSEGFDSENFVSALNGVGAAIGSAFGNDSDAPAAKNFGGMVADGLNMMADVIREATPLIQDIAGVVKILADNAHVVVPIVARMAGAFLVMNAVSSVVGMLGSVGAALGAIGLGGGAAGTGLTAMAGGEAAAGAAASASVGQLLAVGGAVLMIGGGVALAALGLGLMAQSAIALAEAGAPAAAMMLGMVGALFALGAGAYFAGPAFLVAAPGILAFGAATLMVGAGIGVASAGLSLLASQLPMIAQYGMMAGPALTMMGAGLLVMGAGSMVAGAGLLVCAPGLLAFSAAAAPAAGAVTLLSGAIGLLAGGISASADGVGTMGWGMQAMADSSIGANAGLSALAQSSAMAAPVIAAGAPSLAAYGAAAQAASGGLLIAAGSSQAMAAALLALPGAAAAGTAAFSAFAAGVAGAMRSAESAVSAACSSMRSTVSGLHLQIPTIKVSALPHFRLEGEFNAETRSVPSVRVDYYARGGFTNGPVAIAGEAGTEAVISFDQRYRDDNIGYWLTAGQMLGVMQPFAAGGIAYGAASPLSVDIASPTGSLATAAGSSQASGGVSVDFGGVTFAPQISVAEGDAGDIMTQLRDAQDELMDMLEEWIAERMPEHGYVL